MRLRKRNKTYSLVHEENGRQVWRSTHLRDKTEADKILVKERKAYERRQAGLPPCEEDDRIGLPFTAQRA
jgi:hypothetical protein